MSRRLGWCLEARLASGRNAALGLGLGSLGFKVSVAIIHVVFDQLLQCCGQGVATSCDAPAPDGRIPDCPACSSGCLALGCRAGGLLGLDFNSEGS